MTGAEMKAELLCYWRYKRQCPLIGVEAYGADVFAVDRNLFLILVEVKVSLSDLYRESKTKARKHLRLGQLLKNGQSSRPWHDANLFYFAVPQEILDRAKCIIEKRFPHAGLLTVRAVPETIIYRGHWVGIVRRAPVLHNQRMSIENLLQVVRAQSATLAMLYSHAYRWMPSHPVST